jgi:hypothetical protein
MLEGEGANQWVTIEEDKTEVGVKRTVSDSLGFLLLGSVAI